MAAQQQPPSHLHHHHHHHHPNPHQQNPSSTMTPATHSSKISPRKFSEKIALLNKKEAEGTAEFEEIIKEVQATRSQSACSNQINGSHQQRNRIITSPYQSQQLQADEQTEIEEVYEDLLKCVNDFEQELENAHPNLQSRSASAGAGLASGSRIQQQHHLRDHGQMFQQQQHYDNSQPTITSSPRQQHFTNDNNNDTRNHSGFTTKDFSGSQAFYAAPYQHPNQVNFEPITATCSNDDSNHLIKSRTSAPLATSSRARVTSFGSAAINNRGYAHLAAAAAAVASATNLGGSSSANCCQSSLTSSRYNPYPSDHVRQSKQAAASMHLLPNPSFNDKMCWQKSCSDPTLHVPNAPISQAISCSDNLLRAIPATTSSASSAAIPVATTTSSAKATINALSNTNTSNQQHHEQKVYLASTAGPQEAQSRNLYSGAHEIHRQHQSLLPADVPNIEICNIDDDRQNATHFESRSPENEAEPSIPDLGDLQFSGTNPSRIIHHQTSSGGILIDGRHCYTNQDLSAEQEALETAAWSQSSKVNNLLSSSDRGPLNTNHPSNNNNNNHDQNLYANCCA